VNPPKKRRACRLRLPSPDLRQAKWRPSTFSLSTRAIFQKGIEGLKKNSEEPLEQFATEDFKGRRLSLTIGYGSDRIEISVFEQEIKDFRGFCEEKQKFYSKSAQKLRLFHITTALHFPNVVHVQQHAKCRRPGNGNFIKFRSTSSRCWWMSRGSDFGRFQSERVRSSVVLILDSSDPPIFFLGMGVAFMGSV
jgi:hypothetical protein